MRIITGKYKGRSFDIPRTFKARPTTDFAKENLFNVLRQYTDFDGCRALDLFSGTGSITLELLSRGCRQVVSVEKDRDHHHFISSCLKKLADDAATALRADVFLFVKKCRLKFDIIFADPPYALPNLAELPDIMTAADGLLADDNSIFILEHGKDHDFSNHPLLIDHRTYGSVNFSIFKKRSHQPHQPH